MGRRIAEKGWREYELGRGNGRKRVGGMGKRWEGRGERKENEGSMNYVRMYGKRK